MALRKVTQEELDEILRKHKVWLESGGKEGERADLSECDCSGLNFERADMRHADMRDVDMRDVVMRGADMRHADMRGAVMSHADMRHADMRHADMRHADMRDVVMRDVVMRGADMRGADMRGADMDYSCLPLWCGSLGAHFDDKQIIQILYHACKAGIQSKNTSDEIKDVLCGLKDVANRFHRVDECGRIE